jgi:hypothetical protein
MLLSVPREIPFNFASRCRHLILSRHLGAFSDITSGRDGGRNMLGISTGAKVGQTTFRPFENYQRIPAKLRNLSNRGEAKTRCID